MYVYSEDQSDAGRWVGIAIVLLAWSVYGNDIVIYKTVMLEL